MPYFDRLLSDSGVAFDSDNSGIFTPVEAAADGGLEADELVEWTAASSPPPIMRKAATAEAPALDAPVVSAAEPNTTPQPASAAAAGPAPKQDEHADVPSATPHPLPMMPAAQPAKPEVPVIERTPEERLFETIAAVRAWTSQPVKPREPSSSLEQDVEQPRALPAEAPVLAGEQSQFEPPFITVQQPQQAWAVPRQVERQAPAAPRTAQMSDAEPEVVTVSLNIGSIEVVVDASDDAKLTRPEPPQPQHASEPDTASRLRRHYYLEPI
jgi:hypothetical protein